MLQEIFPPKFSTGATFSNPKMSLKVQETAGTEDAQSLIASRGRMREGSNMARYVSSVATEADIWMGTRQ
jgi:hypothetical protein